MNTDDTSEMLILSVEQLKFVSDTAYQAGAATEREACARLCDDMVLYTGYDCASAIRARGSDAA